MKASNFIELDKKQNELRSKRNNLCLHYQNKVKNIQQEIDNIELQKYCVNEFLHKYVLITCNGHESYMYINEFERLYNGPRFKGFGFNYSKDKEDNYTVLSIFNELTNTVLWEYLDNIIILSESEYNEKLFECFKEVKSTSFKNNENSSM